MSRSKAPAEITATVPAARVGQVVNLDGTYYRVTEINLYRPDRPRLAPVQILTRRDKATGQPAYDYYLKTVWDVPNGRFMRPASEGFRRYEVYEVVTRRYEII